MSFVDRHAIDAAPTSESAPGRQSCDDDVESTTAASSPVTRCKSCTSNLDCDEGEICEGGSGRRKLRFGNIHDGCCRIADEL